MAFIDYDEETLLEDYWITKSSLSQLITDTSFYFDLHPDDLRWFHFRKYAEDKLNVVFAPVDIPTEVNGKIVFNGKTVRQSNNEGYVITYNTTKKLNKGRQNFTVMHEISHVILHMNRSNVSVMNKSNENSLAERQADIGASELMIPTTGILEMFGKKSSFAGMCNTFECSYSALTIRLLNMLVFEYQVSLPYARQFVNGFRYKDDSSIKEFVTNIGNIESYFEFFRDDGYLPDYDDLKSFIDENIDGMSDGTSRFVYHYLTEFNK